MNENKQILIVTLGEKEAPIFEGFRRVKDIEKVVFLTSKKLEPIAKSIGEKISSIYPNCEICFVDEKNLSDIIKKIIELHKKYKKWTFTYNLTGGTKIMSIACHVVASFLGEKAFYIAKIDEGKMVKVDIPILKLKPQLVLGKNDRKYQILKLLNSSELTLTQLSNKLKLKMPTIKGHLNKLLSFGLISCGKNKKYFISQVGKIFLGLIEVDKE